MDYRIFSVCAQMLMHAIAHRSVRTYTTEESALNGNSGRNILSCTGESNLRQRSAGQCSTNWATFPPVYRQPYLFRWWAFLSLRTKLGKNARTQVIFQRQRGHNKKAVSFKTLYLGGSLRSWASSANTSWPISTAHHWPLTIVQHLHNTDTMPQRIAARLFSCC